MRLNSQKGFSLVEVFVALAVGLALLSGVLSVFVGMRTTTSETSSYGEMQENGRFAISVITDDLMRQDFWGNLAAPMDFSVLRSAPAMPAVPSPECVGGGVNNGSFPTAVGKFRTLWGVTATSADNMGCIDDAKLSSDILQIKRAISAPLTLANPLPDPVPAMGNSDRYYLIADSNSGNIFVGNTVPANIRNPQVWEYQHHIYYVREESQGSNVVPVLRQGRLDADNGMDFDVLIEGIEMIRFMYGVDTDVDVDTVDYFNGEGDGIVDAYISADNMTDVLWDNKDARILAVKVFVLVRDILPDANYENKKTYIVGDTPITFDDNYRRLLFSSTVTLHNSRVDTWN